MCADSLSTDTDVEPFRNLRFRYRSTVDTMERPVGDTTTDGDGGTDVTSEQKNIASGPRPCRLNASRHVNASSPGSGHSDTHYYRPGYRHGLRDIWGVQVSGIFYAEITINHDTKRDLVVGS